MNIKEIAKLAGVSASTVSKVINKKDKSISAKTREKILKIVRENNYTPYPSPNHSIKNTITVLTSLKPHASSLLKGILASADTLGYKIELQYIDENNPISDVKSISSKQTKAIIIDSSICLSKEVLENLEKSEIPFISIDTKYLHSLINYSDFSEYLTHCLIEKKHKNIACIFEKNIDNDFLEGYKRALFNNKISFKEDFVFTNVDKTVIPLLHSLNISGLVCENYSTASYIYELLLLNNIKVPYDFSILCLQDIFDASSPVISSALLPYFYLGKHITKELIENNSEKKDFSYPLPFLSNPRTLDAPPNVNSKKILVLGSINIDHYLKFSKLPTTGQTTKTNNYSSYAGGKATNVAVGVARLGQRVSIIGSTGDDAHSKIIFDALNHISIDSSAVKISKNTNTGSAYIFVESSGKSLISLLSGANEMLREKDIYSNKELFNNTAFFIINTEVPLESVIVSANLAKECSAKVILKPSSSSHLPDELVKNVDILVPNIDEINEISPVKGSLEDMAHHFLNKGIEHVIITKGKKGCELFSNNYRKSFPAQDFQSVDSTGASDAFISCLASYLLYGCNIKKSIEIAMYAAGFSVTREGVVPSLIDKNTLENLIMKNNPKLLEDM